MKIRSQQVQYMPKELEPGVLYVSKEFCTAAHLCACGCGEKVRTPLSPTEWTYEETPDGPTLWPSIGNWQQPCNSHYIIRNGQIVWAQKWTHEQIEAGRKAEEFNRKSYYEKQYKKKANVFIRVWKWIKRIFDD